MTKEDFRKVDWQKVQKVIVADAKNYSTSKDRTLTGALEYVFNHHVVLKFESLERAANRGSYPCEQIIDYYPHAEVMPS